MSDAERADNPRREDWQTPYGVPPFAQIDAGDYRPAISKAITELRSEIAAIEARFGLMVILLSDDSLLAPEYQVVCVGWQGKAQSKQQLHFCKCSSGR